MPRGLRGRLVRLGLLLVLVGGAVAQAQCVRGPSTSSMTLKGFATAYFGQLRTDSAHDAAELYGGVCMEGESTAWTLTAQRIDLRGLTGTLQVSAASPTLSFEGWQAHAATLQSSSETLSLSGVSLSGHGVAGAADALTLDFASGRLQLRAFTLHGAAFYLSGSGASLEGEQLSVQAPSITSCHCAGSPLYHVDGASAQVDLKKQRAVLKDAVLSIAGVHVPLASPLSVDASSLASLTLPLSVAYVASDPTTGTVGTGLGVLLTHLGLAPGVYAQLGATGLDPAYPLSGVALLAGHGDGASFSFGKASGGLHFELTSDHAIAPWLDAGFDSRVLEPGTRDGLHESVLHARLHTPLRSVGGAGALTFFAAASTQRPSTGEIAGARLGAAASLSASTTAGAPWGRASVHLGADLSAYPDQGASQWGVEVEPSYALGAGPLTARLDYLAQFTNGGSPFTTTLDRLEPVQRPSATVAVAAALAPGWRLTSNLAAQYDLVGNSSVDAGLNQLDASVSVTRSLRSWQVTVSADAQLAGVIAPNGLRDGTLEAGVSATHDGFEFGTRVRYRTAPTPTGLELVELSAAVPIRMQDVTLSPYLALNLAPTLFAGGLPAVSGHGLDLTVKTCCGVVKLGYRDDEGSWTVTTALVLPTGSPSSGSGAGATCPASAPSAVLAVAASPAPVCPTPEAVTGIMTGSAVPP